MAEFTIELFGGMRVRRKEQRGGFGLSSIGQIAVPVTDLKRAVEFYRQRLGLKFLFEAPPGLAFFDCAGLRLMLDRAGRSAGGSGSIIYFRVEGIADGYEKLGSRGVSFDDAPHLIHKFPDHELWMCFFHDSEGNSLALMSEEKCRPT
ncbi:MAG TPA: VOC family protein [Gemmatimonadaceae bacterium]|nr:VOC family protein [Gemmatimonadaceae bacterium]